MKETLDSLEGAGRMEEDKYNSKIILIYFNPPKSIGGMEGEGQNKFDRDSEIFEGSRRNGGRQV